MKLIRILGVIVALTGAYFGVAASRDWFPFSPEETSQEVVDQHETTPSDESGGQSETTSPQDTSTTKPGPESTPLVEPGESQEQDVVIEVVAWDDFETGTWDGGSGWLTSWEHEGYYQVKLYSRAQQGVYAALLWGNKEGSYIMRCADISSAVRPKLQLWGKAVDFWFNPLNMEEEDYALVEISSDKEEWRTVSAWFHEDDGEPFRLVEYALSSYNNTAQLWIKISVYYKSIQMIGDYPMFYIDDIKIVEN